MPPVMYVVMHCQDPPSVEELLPAASGSAIFRNNSAVIIFMDCFSCREPPLPRWHSFPHGQFLVTYRCRSKMFGHLSATQTTSGLLMGSRGSTEVVIWPASQLDFSPCLLLIPSSPFHGVGPKETSPATVSTRRGLRKHTIRWGFRTR